MTRKDYRSYRDTRLKIDGQLITDKRTWLITRPGKQLIDFTDGPYYHITSTCVRRNALLSA